LARKIEWRWHYPIIFGATIVSIVVLVNYRYVWAEPSVALFLLAKSRIYYGDTVTLNKRKIDLKRWWWVYDKTADYVSFMRFPKLWERYDTSIAVDIVYASPEEVCRAVDDMAGSNAQCPAGEGKVWVYQTQCTQRFNLRCVGKDVRFYWPRQRIAAYAVEVSPNHISKIRNETEEMLNIEEE